MSPNSGWGRLATYYKPWYMVMFMLFLSILSALAMPVVSYVIINLQYAYWDKGVEDDWEDRAKIFLGVMGFWICCLVFISGGEKSLFGVMGEKLTKEIRLNLVEEIMHK